MSWFGKLWGSKDDGKDRKEEEEETPPRLVNGGDVPRPGVETHRNDAFTPFSTPHRPMDGGTGAGSSSNRLDPSRQLYPGGMAMSVDRAGDPFRGGSTYEYYSSLPQTASRAAVAASEPHLPPAPAASLQTPRRSGDAPGQEYGGSASRRQMTGASPWNGATQQVSLRTPADRAGDVGAMVPQWSEAPSAASYRRLFGGSNLPNAAEPASAGRSTYKPQVSIHSTGPRMGPASQPRRDQHLRLAARLADGYQSVQRAQQMQAEANRGAGRLWGPTGQIISKRSRLPLDDEGSGVRAREETPAKRVRLEPPDVGGDAKKTTLTEPDKKAGTDTAQPSSTLPIQPTVPTTQPSAHRRRRRLGRDSTVEIAGALKTEAHPSRASGGVGTINLRKQPPVGVDRLNAGFTKDPVPSDSLRVKQKSTHKATPKPFAASNAAFRAASSSEPEETGQRAPPVASRIVSSQDPSYPMGGNWGNLFQGLNQKNKWKCKACYVWHEDETLDKCTSCETPRFAWKCASCRAGNEDGDSSRCASCGAERNAASAAAEPRAARTAVAAAPPTSSFTFGAPAAASSATSTATAASAPAPPFTFGIPSKTSVASAPATVAPAPAPIFQFTATPSAGAAITQTGSTVPAPAASTSEVSNIAALPFQSASASTTAPQSTLGDIKTSSFTGSSFAFTFPGPTNGNKSATEIPKESTAASRSSDTTAPGPSPVLPSASLFGFGQGTGATPSQSVESTERSGKRRATGNEVFNDRTFVNTQYASGPQSTLFATSPPAPAAPSSKASVEAAPTNFPAAPFAFPPTANLAAMPSESVRVNDTRPSDKSTSAMPPAPFMFGSQPVAGSLSGPTFDSKPPVSFPEPSTSRKRTSGDSESASASRFGVGSSSGLEPMSEQSKALPFASSAPQTAPNASAASSSFGPNGSEKTGIGQSASLGAPPFSQNASFGSSATSAAAPFTFGATSSTAASSSTRQAQQPFHFGATSAPASTVAPFGSAPPTAAGAQFGSSGPLQFGASSTFSSTSSAQPAPQFGFGGQAPAPAASTGFQPFGSLPASSQSASMGFGGGSSFGLAGSTTAPAPAPSFGGFGGPPVAAPATAAFGQVPQQPSQSSFGVASAAPVAGFGASGAAPASFGSSGAGAASFTLGQAPKGRRIVRAKRP